MKIAGILIGKFEYSHRCCLPDRRRLAVDIFLNRNIEMANVGRGWYSREYLPHFDIEGITQFITFSLANAIPDQLFKKWLLELAHLSLAEQDQERKRRVESYLDRGEGDAWLKIPELACMVEQSLHFFHLKRYVLHSWVIMSNHVHFLISPIVGYTLSSILHSLKSFTANQANEYLGITDSFWYPESYDRYIRDKQHYINTIRYIENNPTKVGLCRKPEDWQWSSAYWRKNRPDFQFIDPEEFK